MKNFTHHLLILSVLLTFIKPSYALHYNADVQAEPENHCTNVTVFALTNYAARITWTDAGGTQVPEFYVVKLSSVGFDAIQEPTNGTEEIQSETCKIIPSGTQTATFVNLNPQTDYFIKVFAAVGSGTEVAYKLGAEVPKIQFKTLASTGCTRELFISEYVDGDSYNKYIELYNGTGTTLDLSDYRLQLYANGSASATNNNLLSGSLENGKTLVLAHADAVLFPGEKVQATAANFNGNDAIVLFKVSINQAVDIFGSIGENPGTKWEQGTKQTASRTLLRHFSTKIGSMDNPSSGFSTLGLAWLVYPLNTVNNLGLHAQNCNSVTDLFFSEYIEGTTDNKALEIFNGTEVPIDLSNYALNIANNGEPWSATFTRLTGIINPWETYRIVNSDAAPELQEKANLLSNKGFINFNGNDAVGLFYDTNTNALLDAIGNAGENPATGWAVGGIATATANMSLLRKHSVVSANTNWAASAGTTAENSEWIVKPQNYFTDFSFHSGDAVWMGKNTDWNDLENWYLAQKPSNYSKISVDKTANNPSYALNETYRSIVVYENAGLEIHQTSALTLTDSLIIKSSAKGTGYVLNEGTINIPDGKTKVYRYLPANEGTTAWHYISSPVANAKTTSANTEKLWQSNETTKWDMDNSNSESAWEKIATAEFGVMQGYAYEHPTETICFEGNLTQGFVNIVLTYTDYADLDSKNEGWNLVGNPYTAAIDWNSNEITKTGIDNTIYFWDDKIANYKYYTAGGTPQTNNGALNGGSNNIPVGQAFFVKCNQTTGGNLAFRNDATIRPVDTKAFYKSERSENENFGLKMEINGNGFSDQTLLRFNLNATEDFDNKLDAYKLFSQNEQVPQIYFHTKQNTKLAINTLLPVETGKFPIFVKAVEGKYSLSFSEVNFDSNLDYYLNDNSLSIKRKISPELVYNFDYSGGINGTRFSIEIVSKLANSIENTKDTEDFNLIKLNETLYLTKLGEAEKQISIHDISGKLLYKAATNELQHTVNLSYNGIIVVRICKLNNVQTKLFNCY
ncbi:MAG TPA: hypothetical protein DCQ31_11400 [Bacteroidales bacterium]|nr:hypothetical protein [Bacteroidales bacterium]